MNSSLTTSPSLAGDGPAKPIARHLVTAARVLLGLGFFVFGLNGFFNFIPPPPTPLPEKAMTFIGALMGSGYMLPLIAGIQLGAGVLLLANRFVPLALVLLAPIVVNIVAFHLFLEPSGLVTALVVLVLEIVLLWRHRRAFAGLLIARN